jgi:hypothetical protein
MPAIVMRTCASPRFFLLKLTSVATRRTLNLSFNDLKDPALIPCDADYASVSESDLPIVLQHARLDSPHAELSLVSTLAYRGVRAHCQAVPAGTQRRQRINTNLVQFPSERQGRITGTNPAQGGCRNGQA